MPSVGTLRLLLLVCFCARALAFRPLNRLLDVVRSWDQAQSKQSKPERKGEDWALLIAGSGGWGNYRHQADVCHAYQVLHHGGIKDDNIVVMMANDIAGNYQNPHPGKIFNSPGGPDVYDGVPVDYKGAQVSAQNFLDVLEGKDPAVLGSSGKTIKSGPNDRVFVFFADHGAPGILGMPSGPFLYGDQLMQALRRKAANGGFKDMVLYIEACESGSLFEGMMTDDMNIYVTTAANAHESSWGTYCPGMVPSPPSEFSTCLGDLYSVSWMENSDKANLLTETLEKQFELVKLRTSNNGTYNQGSHAKQYGTLSIDEEPVADYLGALNTGDGSNALLSSAQLPHNMGTVPQREADLLPLWAAVQRAASPAAKVEALAALHAETGRRLEVDIRVRKAMGRLLAQPEVLSTIQATYANQNMLLGALQSVQALQAADALHELPVVEQFVSSALPRAEGAPVVDDWGCLRAMVTAWEAGCGELDQYGMQYSRTFANLCNAGVPVQMLAEAAVQTCQAPTAAA